ALALRKVRKSRGLQLQEISLRTKISLKNLRSIESGGYDGLPPIVYLKGYLVEYAKCLRLHPSHVTRDFLEAAARADRGESGASGKYE
ncbi:MAG: helix-turn-helix domain-containing protein, partial [Myxococcota bacterium]